jgi:hypothetical protein
VPILNYTTTIAASKTVGEIQQLLAKAGAEQVIVRYGKTGEPTALVFELAGEMYMLPCRAEAVHDKLWRDRSVPARYKTIDQSLRVAWRILKDWTEAQVAIIQTGMVKAEEVMLPYMLMQGEQTVYQSFVEQRSERLLEAKGK